MQEASANTRPPIPYRPTEARAIAIRVPLRKPSETSNTNKASYNPATITLDTSEGRLIYYIDKVTGVRRLYIPAAIVKDILAIVYTIERYIGFTRCYERVVGL